MSTLSIEVRRAELDDSEAIAVVHDASWRYAYQGILPAVELSRMIARRGPNWWARAIRSRAGILVLEAGGSIAGYVTFGPNRARNLPQKGEVYELYLMPEYQGVGLGSKLFLTARRELVQMKMDTMLVWALAENEDACRFYRNAGGKRIAQTSERFGSRPLTKLAFGWARAG